MAKKSSVQKQLRREKLIEKFYDARRKLKEVISNPLTDEDERSKAVDALNKLPRNSSPVRSRNRCLLTGRPRGFLRRFGVSRIKFRELANQGRVPGVFKASW